MAIGIFDSGVGGLSVLNETHRIMPEVPLLYFADTKNLPYGNKSEEFIRSRCLEISRFLVSQGAGVLVIACNTAAAAGAESVRELLPIPVVAVEPPIKPAVAMTKSGSIGVLATELTMNSQRFRNLIDRYAKDVQLVLRASNDLVSLVEDNKWNSSQGEVLSQEVADEFLKKDADVVVLGSTHYSYLGATLEKLSDNKIAAVGSAQATAQQVARIFKSLENNPPANFSAAKIWVSGEVRRFYDMLPVFSQVKAEVLPAFDEMISYGANP